MFNDSFVKIICSYILSNPSFCPFSTYPLLCTVEIVGAYVEGLPIPNSSSCFTKDASVNLYGGLVKRCVALIKLYPRCSPIFKLGNIPAFSSSSLSFPSKYTFRKPSKFIISPFAVKIFSLSEFSILTFVRSNCASLICEANVLFQIKSYNLF